jgi:pimeloyl-ACP methyl ester carboxylesterase
MGEVIDQVLTLDDGRRIGYRARGSRSARPIVWFHGQPGSRLEADLFELSVLEAADARIIAFDRPGMGRSDLVPAQDMTIDVLDALAVADHLGTARFAVVGVSAGGPPALALAATHPDRVTRVVLSSGAGPYDDETFMSEEDIEEYRQLRMEGAASLIDDYADARDRMLADTAGRLAAWTEGFPENERTWATTGPGADILVADTQEALRQGHRGWLRETEVRSLAWSFDLASLAVPVHAIHGERDGWELLANTRRMIARIPTATLTVIPGGDHFAPLLDPASILAAALD